MLKKEHITQSLQRMVLISTNLLANVKPQHYYYKTSVFRLLLIYLIQKK